MESVPGIATAPSAERARACVADRLHERRTYPAVAASVRLAREDVVALARHGGAVGEQLESIRLAISEAATNVVRHAYRDGPGTIQLTALLADGVLSVLIADDGCGVRTPTDSPGLGWGMALIAQAGERFTVAERPGGGTEALVEFRIAPETN
jgi:serine/threonine-protein kinase RsbW